MLKLPIAIGKKDMSFNETMQGLKRYKVVAKNGCNGVNAKQFLLQYCHQNYSHFLAATYDLKTGLLYTNTEYCQSGSH